MTPVEIALRIRTRPDQTEPVDAFVIRTMGKERSGDFASALDIMIGWEAAFDDFEAMLASLGKIEKVERSTDKPLYELIKAKRARGYDPAFEALLARRWRCPHCKQFGTIEKTIIPIGDPGGLLRCIVCHEPGIYPVETEAQLMTYDGGKSGLRPV